MRCVVYTRPISFPIVLHSATHIIDVGVCVYTIHLTRVAMIRLQFQPLLSSEIAHLHKYRLIEFLHIHNSLECLTIPEKLADHFRRIQFAPSATPNNLIQSLSD